MRVVDAGLFTSFAAGLWGRLTSSPPQFGQRIAIFCAILAKCTFKRANKRLSGIRGKIGIAAFAVGSQFQHNVFLSGALSTSGLFRLSQ
jgi:hypothetical protein